MKEEFLTDWEKEENEPIHNRTKLYTFCLKVRGKWRLLFGFCPNCNSDAPAIYNCDICCFRHDYNNRPKAKDRRFWWKRYISYLDTGFTIRDVTGFDTIEEYDAYELGKRHSDELIISFIQGWEGKTNSGIGQLLFKKFQELKDNL